MTARLRATKKTADPKYRHYKPKDLAVVRIDGRDVYLGKYDSPESWEKYYRLLAERRTGGHISPVRPAASNFAPDHSVNELLLAFWHHADTYYHRADGLPTAELDNLRLALRPLKNLYGSTPACEFGPMALKAVRQAMADSGLCRRTINQRVARIVRVFRCGVENELVPATVHQTLKAVPGLRAGRSGAKESRKVKPVPESDVEAVRPHLSRQLWTVVELHRLTGMRSGEVLAMRSSDIDITRDVWEYNPSRHKTEHQGKLRAIFLGPKAQEILRPWLRENEAEYLFQPREAKEEHLAARRQARRTPLTPSQRARTRKAQPERRAGDRYDTRTYNHAVARACAKAEVSRWHPHQLRHNAATRLRREFGLDVARVILGHTSPVVTEHYAEVDCEKALAVMAKVG